MARYLLLLLGSALRAQAFVTPATRVRDTTLHAIEAEEIGDAIALQAFRALDAVVDGGYAAGDVLQNKVAPALAQGGDAVAETTRTLDVGTFSSFAILAQSSISSRANADWVDLLRRRAGEDDQDLGGGERAEVGGGAAGAERGQRL